MESSTPWSPRSFHGVPGVEKMAESYNTDLLQAGRTVPAALVAAQFAPQDAGHFVMAQRTAAKHTLSMCEPCPSIGIFKEISGKRLKNSGSNQDLHL